MGPSPFNSVTRQTSHFVLDDAEMLMVGHRVATDRGSDCEYREKNQQATVQRAMVDDFGWLPIHSIACHEGR